MPPPPPPKTASGTSGAGNLADAFGELPEGIAFEFVDEQQPQVIRPAKRSNSHTDVSNEVGKLSCKVESLEKLLRARFDRLSGTVMTLTTTMSAVKEQLDTIDDKVSCIQQNYLLTKVTSQACFPLASAAETNAYLEADPKCIALTERYVIQVFYVCLLLIRSLPRLLGVPYNKRFYCSKMLTAIFKPHMIAKVYTVPSGFNKSSSKEPMPEAIFKTLLDVARVTLKASDMDMDTFEAGVRHRFSSWKLKDEVRYCLLL